MADILEYLNKIENAVYGKDVRQAIVGGISQCYQDGKAGVNDLHVLIDDLTTRLSEVEEILRTARGKGGS